MKSSDPPPREERSGSVIQPPSPHEVQSRLAKAQLAGGNGIAVYYFGTAIWVIGVLLLLGNVTGVFPTFPFAGLLTTVVGVLIQVSGNAIIKNSNKEAQAALFAEAARRQAIEGGKGHAPSASGMDTYADVRQPARQDSASIQPVGQQLRVPERSDSRLQAEKDRSGISLKTHGLDQFASQRAGASATESRRGLRLLVILLIVISVVVIVFLVLPRLSGKHGNGRPKRSKVDSGPLWRQIGDRRCSFF
jgi:hypothetical protein